jgi:PAS domain S-box-containing protein
VRGHSTAEVGQVRRLADFPYNLRLASNTEPIILEENSKNELWPQASEYAAVCSNIGVPLIVRHKIIGALTIDSHKPAQYAHQDAQAAMAFARQAAIAIENARLYSYSQQELAEQVQAEKALRQSQQNYEALVNTVDGIVWETDANFAFTFISKQAEHILGYPVERWLTEQNFWNEHIHPEDRTWAVNFCLEATKENKDHEFQYRMIAADGRVVWLHDFVTLIFENGKAAKLRGLMVDITERKQAEEASRKADERFRIICETVSEYIYDCRVEPDGQIIFETVSDNFVRIMGYTVEELKAHGGWHCLVHPDDRTSVEGLIKKLFARQQVHLEFRGITRSGETRWIRLYPYPIWDETEQRVTRVIGAGQDITERKEAEETLRINQELLQSVINNAGNVIFVKDTEGRYLLINKRFEELFHVSNEDILGKTDYDCFPKEQADLFRSNDMKALLAGAPVQSEEIVSQDDGLHTYIAIKCPLFDKTQKAYAICGIATDITGRLQAEEALIESEGCYRTLVEHAPEAIVILDVEKGRFVEANENGLRLYGLSKEELTKVGPIDMSPPVQPDGRPSLESALEKIRQAVAGETPVFEWMHRNAAGEDIPCEVRLVRFPVTGRILVRGSVTDITERKRAEETLHASEERYRSLFQDSPISLWEEDFSEVKNYIDGLRAAGVSDLRSYFMEHPEEVARCAELVNILQVNKTTVHLADGNSVEDFLAGLNRTFTDKTLEVFREEILALAEGNSTFEAESEALTLKGRKIFIALMLSILPGYEDSWSKVLVSVNDLTERKQAEEALRQSEEQLRQALKMEAVGRLAGGIAHDFNNMLLPIIGYSEILLEQLKQGDPLCHPIEEIKKAGERAAALTKQILAFSRKQVLQPHVLDLNVVVTDMDKMLQRLIGEDIELITKLHPSLWSVKVDPSQIEQVILNLAVNARDAMPNGGDLIIETENVYLDEEYAKNHESVQPGQYVMLAVSDTGCGMDAETQMNIFEPFFTTKERSKGTGLGLSTVYGIIKQSGGNIWVYSEIGHGTTFKIYLPRVIDETEVLKPALVSNETKEGAETILVVEDEEGVRHVLQDILKANGYHVLLAADGIEAVEICDRYENSIHLLITDMVLPQMGGREVAKRLTAARPKIKVIFISGYTENSIGYHGALDAAIPFLQKPFTATALLQKVRQVLKV